MNPTETIERLRDLADRLERMELPDDCSLHTSLSMYRAVDSLDVLRRIARQLVEPEAAEYREGQCFLQEGGPASYWRLIFHYQRGLLGEEPKQPLSDTKPERMAKLFAPEAVASEG